MTVLDYFDARFSRMGEIEDRVAMRDMPLESNCGDTCCDAIDAGAKLNALVQSGFGNDRPESTQAIGRVVADLCGLYICG